VTCMLYSPNDPAAAQLAFDLDQFMGRWHVTHSTLPLWKDKTDVSITYAPIPAAPDSPVQFRDHVEYRKAGSTGKPSVVDGIDTQQDLPTRYKWRGSGLLMIATSRWQILGYNSGQDGQVPWALTYFEKTLFTPAGMDIYSRTPEGLSPDLVEEILAQVKSLGGDVASMAGSFFEIERTLPSS